MRISSCAHGVRFFIRQQCTTTALFVRDRNSFKKKFILVSARRAEAVLDLSDVLGLRGALSTLDSCRRKVKEVFTAAAAYSRHGVPSGGWSREDDR